jgi:hypothetical protein
LCIRARAEAAEAAAHRIEHRLRELERAERERETEPEPEPAAEPVEAAHLLFVRNGSGYRLVEREGPAPEIGSAIELERLFSVTKLGRSPLPRDPRRCAYLELG